MDDVVDLELAETPQEVTDGLMYRPSLPEQRGMLFIFDTDRYPAFWMKNTPRSLDIIFIGRDRRIVGIVEEAAPFSVDPRAVDGKSQFVFEINGGLSKRHGFKAGDPVQFDGFSETVSQ